MAHGLKEGGGDLDLGVIVGVQVDEAGHHPAVRGVKDLAGAVGGDGRLAHFDDLTIADPQTPGHRLSPAPIEEETAVDRDVQPMCLRHDPRVLRPSRS